jgi:hypothetical protein
LNLKLNLATSDGRATNIDFLWYQLKRRDYSGMIRAHQA